jgi:hypothetical protein
MLHEPDDPHGADRHRREHDRRHRGRIAVNDDGLRAVHEGWVHLANDFERSDSTGMSIEVVAEPVGALMDRM